MDSLEIRMGRLERRLRLWNRAAVACLGGAALGVFAAAADSGVSEAVEAKRFALIGPKGTVRAELAARRDGSPYLLMNDGQGNRRLVIELSDAEHFNETPSISLLDGKKSTRLEVVLQPSDGAPVLRFHDDQSDSPRAEARMVADGRMILETFDEKGEPTGVFPPPSSKPRPYKPSR